MRKSSDTLKHKPSRKVVLEEVLASLQDLVSNEFADGSASVADSSEQSPRVLSNGPRKRGRPRKHPLPDSPPAKRRPVSSRHDRQSDSDDTDYTYSQEQADLFGGAAQMDSGNGALASPSAHAPDPATRDDSADWPGQATELENGARRATLRVVGSDTPATARDRPRDPMNSKSANKFANTHPAATESEPLNWADDIPVLTEAVEPDELDMSQLRHVVDESLARKDLAPEARAIAVKVAARLNIEMRRDGGAQLDIKTIMRLQDLLKEALEPKA
jgi:hypothetical protein